MKSVPRLDFKEMYGRERQYTDEQLASFLRDYAARAHGIRAVLLSRGWMVQEKIPSAIGPITQATIVTL